MTLGGSTVPPHHWDEYATHLPTSMLIIDKPLVPTIDPEMNELMKTLPWVQF